MKITFVLKIKFICYLILILILSSIFQWFIPVDDVFGNVTTRAMNEDYALAYKNQGTDIRFDKDEQLLTFYTQTKKASSPKNIRYGTIGWQVRFEPKDGSPKFYARIQSNRVGGDQIKNGYVYNKFVIPLSPSSGQTYSYSVIGALAKTHGKNGYDVDYFATKFAQGATIKFDAIFSIKESGYSVTNAIMDVNGKITPNPNAPAMNRGEFYLTKNGTSYASNHQHGVWNLTSNWDISKKGIRGARGWADPNSFDDFFNKPISVNVDDVVLEKTVRTYFKTTDGADLSTLKTKKMDVKKGSPVSFSSKARAIPGYKLKASAISYVKDGGPKQDYDYSSSAGTRTISVKAENMYHNIYFFYEKNEEVNEQPGGTIVFNPNDSYSISGNRNGWTNKNIRVQATVESGKESVVMKNGSSSRPYKYWDPYKNPYQYCWDTSYKDKNGNWVYNETCETRYNGGYVYSTGVCSFEQTWKATQLRVTGTGTTASGSTVSLGPWTIANGGSITLSSDLKDIKLSATVSTWTAQNDKKFTCGSPPNGGSWTSNTPQGNTSKPSENYDSNSGEYFIDKTPPQIDKVNPTSSGWTNSTVNVTIEASDNLSGFYEENSYVEVTDSSYYQNSQDKMYFTEEERLETKNIMLATDGIYSIKVKLEDIATNRLSEKTYQEYLIDKTSPYPASFIGNYRSYIDEDVSVSVIVGDNLSGVSSTRYSVTNNPYSPSGWSDAYTTTSERQDSYNVFTVNITQPGSWYIHVIQTDRAGNSTYSVSEEFRIVRLGNSNNDTGQTFEGLSNQIWTSPRQMNDKIPRATRFNMLLETYGLADLNVGNTTVCLTSPSWVHDKVDNKVNGKYSITSGTIQDKMTFYSGYSQNTSGFANQFSITRWWKSYIAPYGVLVSLDKNGTRLTPQYTIDIQLEMVMRGSNYQINNVACFLVGSVA